MSNRAMSWAWEAPIAKPGAKFVLVALADHASDHAGEDWTCFPSVERLMQFTSQSRATVERHLEGLTAEGWISRRRRKAANGRLGVYDYVLHRERKEARQAREIEAEVEPEEARETSENGASHAANCSMDHASNCSPAMRQNEGQPCCNLQHVLTPIEPSIEPSRRERARSALPDWANEAWNIWPEAGRKPSSLRLVRAAIQAEIDRGEDPAAVVSGCRAYALDRTAWGASGAPAAAHRFIEQGRWENFTASPLAPSAGLAGPARTGFAAPAAVREAFVARHGDAAAASYLDPCGWREADQVLLARTGAAQRWLIERGYRAERAEANG